MVEMEIPAGNEPFVIDQLYGAVPPVTVKDSVYDFWAVPLGKELTEINSGVGFGGDGAELPTTPAQPEDETTTATTSRRKKRRAASSFGLASFCRILNPSLLEYSRKLNGY